MKVIFNLICIWLTLFISQLSFAQPTANHKPPNIQHGTSYSKVTDISKYYVSEKLDGVRGYWNGKQLLTRQGNLIKSPHWFTQSWPAFPIDGELWLGRNKFQPLLSCVSRKHTNENKENSCWGKVRFMMFDLPDHKGIFSERVQQMQALLVEVPSVYLAMIEQVQLNKISELDVMLNTVIARQGEGLMLHLVSAYYKQGRNSALMKLKKYQDAEATVIAHTMGKGKYQGKLGAVKVRTADGITFKIGSGFSDYQRTNPPEVGTIITFKYNGLTESGIPRFARFWRVKKHDN